MSMEGGQVGDLYQVHTFDPWTPLDETLQTLEDFVQQGNVRYMDAPITDEGLRD